MLRRATSAAASIVAVSTGLALAPPAAADASGQYVRTQSSRVRCWVTATGVMTGNTSPTVICEASSPTSPPWDQWENNGFLQAPLVRTDLHSTGALVDAAGNSSFQVGNIGAANPENDLILNYGQTYGIQGWTITSSPGGTRFVNNVTGHGMFVSIENTYPF